MSRSYSHEQLGFADFIHHFAPKVWHILLSEGDLCAPTDVLCERARKHAAVTAVHLLWYFLWAEKKFRISI
jgi:hypothetical protein